MIILVSLKSDNATGSAVLACTGLKKDPILSDNVILEGVRGLSWPFSGAFVKTQQWSVKKKSINWWMVGPLTSSPEQTLELLKSQGKNVPHPIGTLPSEDLSNNTADLEALKKELAEEPAEPGDPE